MPVARYNIDIFDGESEVSSRCDDPDFVSLPSSDNSYPKVKGLFDKQISDLSSEGTADMIIRVLDASKQVLEGRDYAIFAGVQSALRRPRSGAGTGDRGG